MLCIFIRGYAVSNKYAFRLNLVVSSFPSAMFTYLPSYYRAGLSVRFYMYPRFKNLGCIKLTITGLLRCSLFNIVIPVVGATSNHYAATATRYETLRPDSLLSPLIHIDCNLAHVAKHCSGVIKRATAYP